jgi:hypothetical protein
VKVSIRQRGSNSKVATPTKVVVQGSGAVLPTQGVSPSTARATAGRKRSLSFDVPPQRRRRAW